MLFNESRAGHWIKNYHIFEYIKSQFSIVKINIYLAAVYYCWKKIIDEYILFVLFE